LITITITSIAYATDYLPYDNYIQNLNNGANSRGGTLPYIEIPKLGKGYANRFFTEGTYNLQFNKFIQNITDQMAYSYGGNNICPIW